MFLKCKAQLLAIACTLAMNGSVYADVIDDAYRVCSAMEKTGLITECKVKGWGSTVDVRMDTNGSEARKIWLRRLELLQAGGSSEYFPHIAANIPLLCAHYSRSLAKCSDHQPFRLSDLLIVQITGSSVS
jgi:hypothetical protein